MLAHVSGDIERLEAGGLPLGINPALTYQSGTATIAAGGLLFIFTDGLVEAEPCAARVRRRTNAGGGANTPQRHG